jgi:hypothetical protein
MRSFARLSCLVIGSCLVAFCAGCEEVEEVASKPPAKKVVKKKAQPTSVASKPAATKDTSFPKMGSAEEEDRPKRLRIRPARGASDNSSSLEARSTFSPTGSNASTKYLVDTIQASVDYGPTLVVWIVDRTQSAQNLRQEVMGAVQSIYGKQQSPEHVKEQRLLTALVTYGEKVDPLPEPTADAAAVIAAFEKIAPDSQGIEATYAAVKAAGDKYLPYRTQQRREVIFVLVTDEVGNDAAEVDNVIAPFKRAVAPVYVLGVPAPFGRAHLGDLQTESRTPGQPGVVFGPDSQQIEAIQIESIGGNYDLEMMDSGFGPFPLEHLARATDGKFLAVRPIWYESSFFGLPGTEWPSSRARQFDQEVMKKYAPDYVSAAEYAAILNGNAAARALVEAGQLPRAEVRTQLALSFTKRDEAQFARDLNMAQQAVAKLEPAIARLYDVLVAGEGDRAKLTSPRWQASYDVAIGRAAAAKARLEGYNVMLALLKQGKKFENEASTTWRLEPADSSEQAGSAINKLVERSQMYLKRVVAEHPGTPWAIIAERELREQVGWKWVEE